MPAKTSKSKSSPTVKKSNTAKTSRINRKVKFNWKIAAVIGVVLIAALGYLYVRLSQAATGIEYIPVTSMSENNGATKGQKNGQPVIDGPGFADKYLFQGTKSYPSTASIYRYTVAFFDREGDGQVFNNGGGRLSASACNRTLVDTTAGNGGDGSTISIDISSSSVYAACGNTTATIKISVGIPRGTYIKGIDVSDQQTIVAGTNGTSVPGVSPAAPAPAAPTSTAPAPAPGTKAPAPAPQGICEGQNVFGPGSQGGCVRIIQQRLTDLGYSPGPVDGIYGQKTAEAVKVFQQRSGLPQDGVVGVQTWNALTSPNAARKQ